MSHLQRYLKNNLASEARAICHQALGLPVGAKSAVIDDDNMRSDGTGQGCPPDPSASHQNLIVNGCKPETLQALQADCGLQQVAAGTTKHNGGG